MGSEVLEHEFKVSFDGSNCNNWKFRIETLDEHYLLNFTKKEINRRNSSRNSRWRNKIKGSKKEMQIGYYFRYVRFAFWKDKKPSKEIIDCWTSISQRKSIASQLSLRKRLLTMKFGETLNVSEHFRSFG